MKAKVISQPNKEGTPSRSSGYLVPIALSLLSTTLAQCVEAAVVNKNLLFSAEEIRIFSNESADLSVKDKVLLENYTVNASLLLNPLNEVGTLNFSPKDTNVYQYKGKSNDGAVNTVEFALTDVVVNGELGNQNSTKTPIISFRNDNVDPIKGEFDVSIKSFLFDTQLPGSVVRSETKDHTIITFQGADLNKKNTPFMIIVLDKLPADANINKALQDANLVKEVTIINSVTGESIDIPQNQDQVISTQQTSAPPSLVDLIGMIIEPSEVVQAQGLPTNTPEPTAIPVPMIEVGGLQIPDPKASNPELFDVINPDSPIVQFANAFGIKPEEVAAGLQAEIETPDGLPPFAVLRTSDGVALMMAQQGENGEWKWQEAILGRYWAAHDKSLGFYMKSRNFKYLGDSYLNIDKFADGGILSLGTDTEKGKPVRNADKYMEIARNNNMNYLFHYVFEPGKDESITTDNVDEKLQDRITELSDLIIENGSGKSVFLELNESLEKGGIWNRDANPLKDKYGNAWLDEYFYQVLKIPIDKGLNPNVNYTIVFNEAQMMNDPAKREKLHSYLVMARDNAFNRIMADPDQKTAKALSEMGINSPEDINILVGVEVHSKLEGPDVNPEATRFPKVPTIEQINATADLFADLGGIIMTEFHPTGTSEEMLKYLPTIVKALENENLHGVVIWTMVPDDKPDPKEIYSKSPIYLFNPDGTPTELYWELLREVSPSN
ncbi:MAG: hypothetical protein AAB441_00155 [Patescibacteria group bacterium]